MEVSEKTTNSVLVTGADNAVGRAVARRLVAAGYQVTATVTTAAQAAGLRVDNVVPAYPGLTRAGEIKSVLKASGADIIVHAATQAANQVPQLKTDWTAAQTLIEQGTPALITAAQESGVKLIVFLSYAFAGDVAHGGHGDSDHGEPADPSIVTAVRAAEQALIASSVPVVILRAGYTYGPYSKETIALRDAVKKNSPLALGDAHASVNWIQIDDLTSAVIQAIDRKPEGQILDVVDDQPTSPTAFAGYLAQSMNIPAPGPQPSFVNRVRYSQAQRDLLDRSVHASNTQAKDALGWTPQFANYRVGLDQMMLVLRAEEPIR